MTLGALALTLALPLSIYSALRPGKKAVHLVTILLGIASLMLIYAFVTNDFGIEYVYSYSSIHLPLVYKLSGIWAGLDGSLLFWALLVAICGSVLAMKKEPDAVTISVIQVVVVFFLIMLVFQADPFRMTGENPPDGYGMNPLLQNFFMLIHPPALYIGYVGFTVPFAYVISGLLKKDEDGFIRKNLPSIRFWLIISWFFLTLGNLLGAMWAYVELGWGGFWAWDPVENAGILPWFTACALLHSIIMEERRGMLKRWNILLIILTFLLTIFGTFITRSGVIQSVHSFSDITIGAYFLVFLALATFISFYLLFSRRKKIKSKERLESLISYEGAFCINNVLFIFALVVVLWGTVLPLFAEWFMGQKLEVGPPFFNRALAPVGIALLLLTGIGPEMSWRRYKRGLFKREFLLPTVVAVAAAVISFAMGVRESFPLFVAFGAAFALTAISGEFISAARAGKWIPRRHGGYIVHIGIVLLFIGIAGSVYKSEHHLALEKGGKAAGGGYEFVLDKIDWTEKDDSEGVVANISVAKNGRPLDVLRPALFMHRNQQKPIAEVDLNVGLLKDVYIALAGVSEDGRAELTVTITPLISFVWIGGVAMCIGTMITLLPRRSKRDEEMELDIALGRADKEDLRS